MHCKPILLILLTRIKYMSRSILGNEVNKIGIQDADDYFSEQCIFKDRIDAGKRLADKLKLLIDRRPSEFIILAIPRGGVVTGDVIASATMFAAIRWLGKQKLNILIVAVPVVPKDTSDNLRKEVKVNKAHTNSIFSSWCIL